jgi:hypothetical protein
VSDTTPDPPPASEVDNRSPLFAKGSFASYPDRKPGEFLPAKDGTTIVVTGRIEYVQPGPRKVWRAEDTNHFALSREDVPAERLDHRIILRETPAFKTMEDFKPFTGKRVEIRGRIAGHVKFHVEVDKGVQFPIATVDRDGYALYGGGLLVDEIKVLDEPAPKP